MKNNYDYIIVGAGIIGLTIAYQIRRRLPLATILIIDKEPHEAFHASSRNSGVLHAGFYYTANSLKAQFTVNGNKAMRSYCERNNLPINTCGKLVIAQNETELQQLYALKQKGDTNGSNIKIISEKEALTIDPNVKTYKKALFSPDTASVNPKTICQHIKEELESSDVHFSFNNSYKTHHLNTIETKKGFFGFNQLINCAGLYADKIANDFGFSQRYTIIPFKGLYLKYTKNSTDIKTNIYPVPDPRFPFLGVHFTKTVDGHIKIGPTAIPAFWRENYAGWHNFKWQEFGSILTRECDLFIRNASGFRDLAFEELKKHNKQYLIKQAAKMVQAIDHDGFTEYTAPGIRAQLLDTHTKKLVQDFIIEADRKSVHVLNAVSPAFTCSFPFAEYVCQKYIFS